MIKLHDRIIQTFVLLITCTNSKCSAGTVHAGQRCTGLRDYPGTIFNNDHVTVVLCTYVHTSFLTQAAHDQLELQYM